MTQQTRKKIHLVLHYIVILKKNNKIMILNDLGMFFSNTWVNN